jgi:hypothetical protein
MPSFADDRLVPGSERAVEIVDTKLMRQIVADLRKPPTLPMVDPSAQAPPRNENAGAPAPLALPPGIGLIDAMCNAASERERLEKILELNRRLQSLQALQDAKIYALENQLKELEERLKKTEGGDFIDFVEAVVEHDEAKTKKAGAKAK